MKAYTTYDKSTGSITDTDHGLTLQGVSYITDWTDEEFDKISELAVGECIEVDGVGCIRTK
ncbi:hypothetical protein [Pantoea phage Nufs112]|jgi:hypothetical protein|nr:hypothetical protein [Pantoea phage Nufs112]